MFRRRKKDLRNLGNVPIILEENSATPTKFTPRDNKSTIKKIPSCTNPAINNKDIAEKVSKCLTILAVAANLV